MLPFSDTTLHTSVLQSSWPVKQPLSWLHHWQELSSVLSRAGYAGLNIETTQPITSFLLTPSYLTMLCMCNFASRSLLLVRGCDRHGQESVNIAGFLPHGTSPRLVLPVRDMSKHRRPHAALIPMHTHTTPNALAPPPHFHLSMHPPNAGHGALRRRHGHAHCSLSG